MLKEACKSDYGKRFGRKCNLFTNDQRQEILTEFYGLDSLDLQRQYVCSLIETDVPIIKKLNFRIGHRNDWLLPFFGVKI